TFHVVLRIEVRSGGVGGTAGVDHRQLTPLPQLLERREARVETEEAVEIERAVLRAGRRHRDSRPRACIFAIAKRDDEAEAVDGAPLKDGDEPFRVWSGFSRPDRPSEKRGCKSQADERERAVLEDDSTRYHLLLPQLTRARLSVTVSEIRGTRS